MWVDKHSELPFRVGSDNGFDAVYAKGEAVPVCTIALNNDGNAPFIVLACNNHYKLLKSIETALYDITEGVGLIKHKFERAGGVSEVAHKGVQLGAVSWASNVENGLHNIELAVEALKDEITEAEGK